jgi:hypothetical protein
MPIVLELGAGGLLGVMPEVALVGSLGVELEVARPLTLGVAALGTLPTHSARVGGEVSAHVLGGRAASCLAHVLGGLRASGCVGVLAGVMQARGDGFALRDARTHLGWLALLAGVAADLPMFGAFSLRAALSVGLPLVRPELRVGTPGGNTRVAHTAAPVSATASLALLWALR